MQTTPPISSTNNTDCYFYITLESSNVTSFSCCNGDMAKATSSIPVLARIILKNLFFTWQPRPSKRYRSGRWRSWSTKHHTTIQMTATFTNEAYRRLFPAFVVLLLLQARVAAGQSSTLSDVVVVQLQPEDLNAIKSDLLCTSPDNCQLSYLSAAVLDAYGIPIQATSGQCVPLSQLIKDQTPPSLVQFIEFDFNAGLLVLSFTEVVNTSSVNFTDVSLSNSPASSTKYSLKGGSVLDTTFSINVTINLTIGDLNQLKYARTICLDASTCWVRFTTAFLRDVSGTQVAATGTGATPNRASALVIPDTTSPYMVSFAVNMTSAIVTLTFDETISVVAAFNQLTFYAANDGTSNNYTLTAGNLMLSQSSATVLAFQMSGADFLNIKAIDNFFTNVNNTYVTFPSTFVTDWLYPSPANPINPRAAGVNALQATSFARDTIPPVLVSFALLDMNNDLMRLSFNEPVSITNVNFSNIVLRSSTLSTATLIRLTGGTVTYQDSTKMVVQITFTTTDIETIKSNPTVARSAATSILQLLQGAFTDITGNPNSPSQPPSYNPVATYIADTFGPDLRYFALDLNANTLTLSFNDVVNTSTLVAGSIVLQSDQNGASRISYTLTSGSFTRSPLGMVVVVNLSLTDSNAIKATSGLCTSYANTYISYVSSLLISTYGLLVLQVPSTNAFRANLLITDITPPQLVRFDLNMSGEVLVLYFSETVNVATFDVTQITIQNARYNASDSYTLTSGYVVGGQYVNTFSAALSRADLNVIKADTRLAVSNATTFLGITNSTVQDSAGNNVVAISTSTALGVTLFVPDTVSPLLFTFNLDMNRGLISLTFDETVNASTFQPPYLVLQGLSVATSPPYYYNITGGVSTTLNSPFVTLNVTTADLNAIKAKYFIATSVNNSYILLYPMAVRDLRGNLFATNHPSVQATSFIPDTTSPVLSAFSFDLNTGTLSLTFSETVYSPSLNVTAITLLSGANGTVSNFSYSLTSGLAPFGSVTASPNATVINVLLGSMDLNELKRVVGLADSPNDTFVSITPQLISDMVQNQVTPIPQSSALGITTVLPDLTPPSMVSSSLDLNTGTLTITFSETAMSGSLNVSAISLLSNNTQPLASYRLTNTSAVVSGNAVTLTVILSPVDLNTFKFQFRNGLAGSVYVRLDSSGVLDMSGNAYVNGSAISKANVTADTMQPQLAYFSLDMNVGVLSLTFSEVVNSPRLSLTAITLHDNQGVYRNLTGGTVSGSDYTVGHPPVVDVALNAVDLNEIKRLSNLLTNATTYISIGANATQDVAVVPNSLAYTGALKVSVFTQDVTPPRLLAFNINLTSAEIVLFFDETVATSTFLPSLFTLQSSQSLLQSIQNYTLQSTVVGPNVGNTPIVTLSILSGDLNAIKLLTSLCTSRNNCFLSAAVGAIYDMSNNPLTLVPSNQSLQATNVTLDTIPPTLITFELDMNQGLLQLDFSEPVNVTSLRINQLQILAYPGANGSNAQRLTTGTFPQFTDTQSPNGVSIVIRLGTTDLYSIQTNLGLAKLTTNTFLSAQLGTVLDMYTLPLVPVTLNVSGYIADTTPPVLLGFSLDMNAGVVSLTFNETVRARGSLVPGGLTLYGTNNTVGMPSLSLVPSTVVQSNNAPVVNLTLVKVDLDTLKLLVQVGTSVSNTYLRIMMGAVQDMANVSNGIATTVLQASAFIPDTTPPNLVSYTVDFNANLMVLNFDEPVNSSSLNVAAITLLNSAVNATANYTLTGGSVITQSGLQLVVNMTNTDLNAIKRLTTLLAPLRLNVSYLAVTSAAVKDMAGIQVNPTVVPIATYFKDTTNPSLVLFLLDMNTGTVTLSFTEVINISSIVYTQFTLLQSLYPNTTSFTLTGGNLVTTSNTDYITFTILPADLNEIKRQKITSFAYISFNSTAFFDVSFNPVVPVAGRIALFTPDTTPPAVTRFDLNLTSNTLYLYFSEVVNVDTLDVTSITLQQFASGGLNYTLTHSSLSTSPSGLVIAIGLGTTDLNQIKLLFPLATSNATSFISYTSVAIADMSGNWVANRTSSSALQVSTFTPDIVPPTLSSYVLNLTEGTLTLSFSEVVNASSFSVLMLVLQGTQTLSNTTTFFKLAGGSVSKNSDVIVVNMTIPDLNEIKRLRFVGTVIANTFLSFSGYLVQDMAGNWIVPISNQSAQQAKDVIANTIPPMLLGFSLDMNLTVLTLTFSETVSAPTLQVSSLILQDGANSSNTFTLTGGTTQLANSSVIKVTLSVSDSNLLKQRYTIATSVNNTYLLLLPGTVQDMGSLGIAGIPNGQALQVSVFVPDTTPPQLAAFVFDRNTGQVLLTFVETVNVQSLNPTALTLLNRATSSVNYTLNYTITNYTLTGGTQSPTNSTNVVLTLIDLDLNAIKALLTLGTSVNNTYLSITISFIRDMSGNTVVPITTAAALQAQNVILDTAGPQLLAFGINMSSNVISLTFSETVSAGTFNPTNLTLYVPVLGAAAVNYTLTTSYVTPLVDSTVIYVQLSSVDSNQVKVLSPQLATSESNTFLAISSGAIKDTSGNPVLPANLNASAFAKDIIPPVLLSFSFNLTSGVLTLTFSKTVNASTLSTSSLAFQVTQNVTLVMVGTSIYGYYRLTPASVSQTTNGPIIQVYVQGVDLNAIKADPVLAISNATTYLSADFGSVLDMSGNPLVRVPSFSSLPVSVFYGDLASPQLVAFNLYLSPGSPQLTLQLVFSETVNASTLNLTSIVFSNTPNVSSTSPQPAVYRLTGGSMSLAYSTMVNVNISYSDLAAIRQLDQYMLLTTNVTAFVSVSSNTIRDMAGNPLVPITLTSALNVNNDSADLSPPVLQSAVLDRNLGILSLLFPEPILAGTYQKTFLTLQSGASVNFNTTLGSFYTLTDFSNVTASGGGSTLVITLTTQDFNAIKALSNMATSVYNTFVSIRRGLVKDTSLNDAVVIPATSALMVTTLIMDTTPPQLVSFDVNLTSNVVTFSFSETIMVSSVDVTQFRFQNSISSASLFYSLTDSWPITTDSAVLMVQLSFTDSNAIKGVDGLLKIRNNTFLSISREAATDMSGNSVLRIPPSNALLVNTFTQDALRPLLVNFTVDMNQGLIYLSFDKTVRSNGPVQVIQFGLSDLNQMKSLYFCTTRQNCLLYFTADLVLDMVGLPVIGISRANATQPATAPVADTTSPVLLVFSVLDMNKAHLGLTGGTIPSLNTSYLNITLTSQDLDAIKQEPNVCSYRGNCYLLFDSTLVSDMSGNSITPVDGSFPGFNVQQYIPDTTNPILLAFDLNMQVALLTLYFSEPVDVPYIDVTEIGLQGSQNVSGSSVYYLTGASYITYLDRVVILNLTASDVTALRSSSYYKSRNTTYLSVASSAVRDLSFYYNLLVPIYPYNALPVQNFTADTSGPLLLDFSLDYNANQLVLTFNEPVLPQTINFTQISVSSQPASGITYSLTGGTVQNAVGPGLGVTTVVIALNQADATFLKTSTMIAVSTANTYISLNNRTVYNTFNIPNTAVPGLQLKTPITLDTTAITIQAFDLNLNNGLLTLYFSDVANTNSFYARGVAIQNAITSNDSSRFVLTLNSKTMSPSGYQLVVQLSRGDLNSIEATPNLATSNLTTFSTLDAVTVQDMFGNNLIAVVNGKAIQVRNFTADTTPPSLVSFVLDKNTGALLLTFSKAVNLGTLNLVNARIQSNLTSPAEVLALNASSSVTAVTLDTLRLSLVAQDLNSLKAMKYLGVMVNYTFVSLPFGFVNDYVGNPINQTVPLEASSIVQDVLSPSLVSFMLDFNTGTLLLTFSETVNASTLDVTKVAFQAVQVYRTGVVYFLHPSSAVAGQLYSPVVSLVLSAQDLNTLKQLSPLASNISTTYISLGGAALLDTSGNPSLPVSDTNALQATKYTPDISRPLSGGPST
ncbi:hypothetical protein EMCRGX_G018700 [Ephydatia muelleri]